MQGGQRGKSLIKILMVIAIIGIVLLPVIAGDIKKANGVGTPQNSNDPGLPLLGPSTVPADHNWDE